ncbi:YopX family protein [Lacticaseibacillus mingshuiensis]|uniref:YopX family protein n=1 Tax=Lacticaseibacillus mingshuiensis TaxID=2799574 RepID=A0ABW4CLZ7_9LACO|nr:YopX family protein [Lacticaseibacillus mingshuiensis]
MREIKFRVWDHNTNTMMIPDYFEFYDGKIDWIEAGREAGPESGNDGFSDQFEIMQYIGLHDKNGREIYEGDIIVTHPKTKYETPKSGVVQYGDCRPMFQYKSGDGEEYSIWNNNFYRTYEVIGNIFENPKLLEAPV